MFGPESYKQYMVVTQSAPFCGWKGMDPALIPKFEEGEREDVARDLLGVEGKLLLEFYSTTERFEHLIRRHHSVRVQNGVV